MRDITLLKPIAAATDGAAPAQTITLPTTPTAITSISGFTLSGHCDRLQFMNITGGAAYFYVGAPSGADDAAKRANMFLMPAEAMIFANWTAEDIPNLYLASDSGSEKAAILQEKR